MRLEQSDSYLTSFQAGVRALRRDETGTWVALDRSAFYPTSGGQPHDTGELGAARVVDVILQDGERWHRVDGPEPAVGERVDGRIDWDRRYRHMQRHSAQHLLSQALIRVDPGFGTRSVSLRGADCTLDVAGEPTRTQLEQAQTLVNAFGYRNLPITAFEVDEAALAGYPLRRPPKVHGRIRLVAMGDVEVAACGGTHLASTAEALPIVLLGSERIRGGQVRLTFRAGWEALEHASAAHATLSTLVAALSTPAPALPDRVRQLQLELATARAAAEAARQQRAQELAGALLAAGTRAGPGATDPRARVVRAVVDDALLDDVADALQRRPGVVAFLASRTEARARLAFVRGPDRELDLRPLLRAALAEVAGRGGGRPERAQGAGPRVAGTDAALDAAEAALLAGGVGIPGGGKNDAAD